MTAVAPTPILGDLEPGNAVGVKPCIPANEVRVGDTFYAAGFPVGGCRIVREVRIVNGWLYLLVKEGWFRWHRIYANVAEF